MISKDEIANALFDAYDIKRTIDSHSLGSIKRVHGGTDNEDNLEDLIHGVIYVLEALEEDKNE